MPVSLIHYTIHTWRGVPNFSLKTDSIVPMACREYLGISGKHGFDWFKLMPFSPSLEHIDVGGRMSVAV